MNSKSQLLCADGIDRHLDAAPRGPELPRSHRIGLDIGKFQPIMLLGMMGPASVGGRGRWRITISEA